MASRAAMVRWATENKAGREKVRIKFGVTSNQARLIAAEAKASREGAGESAAGFSVAGLKCMDKAPMRTTKDRILELDKGRAYTIAELSALWNVTTATIRNHAAPMKAMLYVEINGVYEQCVLHPETAKKCMEG
jgi:hypothetical protein